MLKIDGGGAKRCFTRLRHPGADKIHAYVQSRQLFSLVPVSQFIETLLNHVYFGLQVFVLVFQSLFFRFRIGILCGYSQLPSGVLPGMHVV